MECEAWLLLAEVDPAPFPWAIVIGALATLAGTAVTVGGATWGIVMQSRNNRLAEQVKALTAEKTEQLKAGTEKGKQIVDLQTQEDKHDETMLDKALARLTSVEQALTAHETKCEEAKEKLRDECRECWKARSIDRDELIALRVEGKINSDKIKSVSKDRHEEAEKMHEQLGGLKADLANVQGPIPVEATLKLDIQQVPPEEKKP